MKLIFYNIIVATAILSMVSCTDWETAEAEIFDKSMTEVVKSEEYYENLRAYKKSDHSIAFGCIASGKKDLPTQVIHFRLYLIQWI